MKRTKILKKLIAVIILLPFLSCVNAHTIEDAMNESAMKKVPKLSVQLWSVKDVISEDFSGTLKKLAQMGFAGVEFANEFGPYANDPKGLKAFLDSLNLQASGAHVSFEQLNQENFQKTVAFYQELNVIANHLYGGH